jgi:hypothetical protein
MQKLEPKTLSLAMSLAAAALLTLSAGAAAQSAGEPAKQAPAQEQAALVRSTVPQVTGTVTRRTRSRLDLQTADGKSQKVAVNKDTEWLVDDVKEGAEVTVEYRRKVSGFVIAQRVLPAQKAAAAAQPGPATAPAPAAALAVTGSVVSWNDAALLLRTEAGDVTLFLSPSTQYLVKPLDAGLRVTAEYREGADRAKVATRVLAAETKSEVPAKGESGSE